MTDKNIGIYIVISNFIWLQALQLMLCDITVSQRHAKADTIVIREHCYHPLFSWQGNGS